MYPMSFVSRSLVVLQAWSYALALRDDVDASGITARAANLSAPIIYRIPQSDPPLELFDYTARRSRSPIDPVVLFQGLLTLSSMICGERSPEALIYEQRTWVPANSYLKFYLSPRQPGSDTKLNYSIACQIIRGVGEYLAQADIRYTILLNVLSHGNTIAIAGGLFQLGGAGESQNGSVADVA